MVGAVRIELTTSWTRTRRATRLRYAPNQKAGRKMGIHRFDCNAFLHFFFE